MFELTIPFVLSQIAMFLAMGFDFLSLQFRKREKIFLCLIISCTLMSIHYFLFDRIAAGIIVSISILRYITCYFTSNKRYLFLFVGLNTIALLLTFKQMSDIVIYLGLIVFIVGNFQADNRLMRKIMMCGTSIIILYNIIILSPMGIIAESSFLISGFIGYYRYYIKK